MKQVQIETVGKLGATYGIRGWLRVYSFTEQTESIFNYQPWFLKIKGQWQEVELESFKHHNHELIVKIKNFDNREQAQTLANIEIGVNAEVFPKLEGGDYYWHDLIGCQVITLTGYRLGIVSELMETGANDVLVVKADSRDAFGKQERLIPFLFENVVKRVDLSTKTIEVDWDAGF